MTNSKSSDIALSNLPVATLLARSYSQRSNVVGWIPGQDLFHADAYDQVLIDLREGME